MPVLVHGSGGGGMSGYGYPLGDVISPDVQLESGKLKIKWGDPEDTGLSEWKGTIIVAKQGSPPKSVDDGIKVAEITTRDQYKTSALETAVGGTGYYYGIFTYTKSYVVNNRETNVKYVDGGLLQYMMWDDIAAVAASGAASQKWNVGDEKTVELSDNGVSTEAVLRIAGFNHDAENSITFEFKTSALNSMTYGTSYDVSALRTNLRNVKYKMPEDLQRLLRTVTKPCMFNLNISDQLWLPSVSEVNGIGYIYDSGDSGVKIKEGEQYAIYANAQNRKKGFNWWTRTVCSYDNKDYSGEGYYYINTDGNYALDALGKAQSRCVCPMFCV